MDKEYDVTPDIQKHFFRTYLITVFKKNEDKSTVFDIFEKTCFYSITHNKRLNSTRMKGALQELSKTVT